MIVGRALRAARFTPFNKLEKLMQKPISKPPIRWHIPVFLAPAFLIYTAVMVIPLLGTIQPSG